MTLIRHHKVAVALSGGMLRGAAHVGVLQALEDMGIQPDAIAGTSAGGVVAALYGRGLSTELLEEVTHQFNGRKLLDVSLPITDVLKTISLLPLYYLHIIKGVSHRIPPGFIVGGKLEAWLHKLIDIAPTRHAIAHLVVTTDLLSGKAVVFYDATERPKTLARVEFLPMIDPVASIRASCSLPGILYPRAYASRLLVDGALRNNLPVDLLYHLGYTKVIAVDLHQSQMDDQVTPSFFPVLDRMMDILIDESMELRINRFRPFVIQPNLDEIKWTSWGLMDKAVQIGRDATKALQKDILAYVET
ncbi:patatin-like phospholipase family protein [Sulfoacidibacillus ferrooxidans]|uniref:NTE family protein n=1 Tax=Sulfoacidibacillus ferrooxidans TaxID=2005001 RepID=A0A9X1V6A7_9BACL|nr:putative NTE family protein [Sulfoacidibacillus ferrooxidans]